MTEGGSPIRVLHVDDDPEFLDLAATYLERQDGGFTIETAPGADAGLDCLAAGEFDCVISDYEMPGMNGIDFLRAVREDYPDLPFVLFTGKGSEEVASEAISAGVTDYLQKQRGTEQYELLANRVTNAVEQRRARSRAREHHRVSSVVREINKALVQATSREEIDHRVCEILTDADPYDLAWIGTIDAATDRIEPQAAAGSGTETYLDDLTVTVDDTPTGHGPGGTAVREDRVVVSQNIDQDRAFEPWREDAREQGYRAVAGIPLAHEDTRYGLLGVYADRTGAFDESERALLEELGDTIAHAYHRLDIQREYEDQYRELFEEAPVMFTFTREVDGEPIIEDCNELFADTLGYAREALRGRHLAEVYTEESARALLGGGGYDRALTGEFVREQREFVTREGDVVTTLLRATPRRNADGEVIGTHALFVDITDQTRLQTLEELRERIEFALDATDSILFELDLESGQETRHGPFERLYGIESEAIETTEEFYEKCVYPDDRDTLRELQRKEELAEGDSSIEFDFRTHPERGQERWIQFEGYLSTDSDGNPERLIGLDTDITERKHHETQLEAEQHRFESLFTQLTVPLVEVEYDGLDPIVTAVNPAFEETFGYDAATVVGESLDASIVPEDRRDEADDINQYVRKGGKLDSREVTRQTADGLGKFLLENAVYEDGSGGFAIYTDISERKRREEALDTLHEATQAFLDAETKQAVADQAVETAREIFEQPITGLWLYDPEREVLEPTAMTDEAVALLGEQTVYAEGESLSWQAFEDGTLRCYDDVQTEPGRLNPETPIRSELILPLGEQGVMNVSATEPGSFSEIDLSLAQLLGQTVEAALERAEREQRLRSQQRELERQNERLDRFTGVVSHDLRNPLQVAAARIELAQEECASEQLVDAANALERMDTLVEDLLTIARGGKQVTDPDTVSLADAIRDCKRSVETDGAELIVETDRTIRADASRLKQILENLIRNAVDHGGGSVTVRIGELDDGFYVADDGPGIPPDERADIFEAGYSATEDGTGFGLNIVREIVDAHGWTVRVTEGSDGGARFEIAGVDTGR
jgi:PAS domain S-box-containing protein